MVEDLAQLTYLVNLNSIELHIPQWTGASTASASTPTGSSSTSTPARPPGCSECAQVAVMVRDRLGALGLDLFPVTSGSKGMQLYAGLPGDLTSDQTRDLASSWPRSSPRSTPTSSSGR